MTKASEYHDSMQHPDAVASVTAELAEKLTQLSWHDLPSVVVEKTIDHILDGIGCACVGTLLPWIDKVRRYAEMAGNSGNSTVIGGLKLVPEWAAFANATSIHGFELDDYHSGALAHPGCVIVPTAFAIGEELGSSGKDILLSCALGMESIVRVGLAVSPSMVVERGFHETGTQGVFGAAVVTAKLASQDATTLISSLGIAGSHASGTRQYSHTGGEVKRLHAGLGASGGIRGAMLAGLGLRGPSSILEGACGFMQCFSNTYDASLLTKSFGDQWDFLECGIKPHASCGLIHAPTDALSYILEENNLGANDVTEVSVGIDRLTMEHCGSLPLVPADMNGAQFNLPYALGMVLAGRGSGFSHFRKLQDIFYEDVEIIAAAKRVKMFIDPEMDAVFPGVLRARVRVRRRDGQWIERVSVAKGSKDSPLDRSQLRVKFIDLLSQTRWASVSNAAADAIEALSYSGDAISVMRYLSL
jgi:2-methylcitrate dehydratase PrpD